MKLLLDDKTTRGYNLNANEACIFAAILKCTRAGRGWYGNYRELAAAMPFVLSKDTAQRAVQKLLNLGLIERREEKLFALSQNETSLSQNETVLSQNETRLSQNLLPPYNPPINNNNEMEKENTRTCVPTHDTAEPNLRTYFEIRKIFNDKHGLHKVGEGLAAEESWRKASRAKRIKLLEAVKAGKWDKPRIDWLVTDFPEPTPDFLRGDEDTKIVQVKYEGKFKLCTPETMQLFGLEFVRDWN